MFDFIELPATEKSLKSRKPLYGVGINDTSYTMSNMNPTNGVKYCPFIIAWRGVISRCYSNKLKELNPTYLECTMVEEWLTFSVFRKWMETQDWRGKQLDKDILIDGNKRYGPDTCIFVSSQINSLITTSAANRGLLPQGVTFSGIPNRYSALCNKNGKTIKIGVFKTINNAEIAYLNFKAGVINNAANSQECIDNPKLFKALTRRADSMIKRASQLDI